MTFILREPTWTFGTAEAAERIGVETQFLSVRLSGRRHWRRFFDIDHPGSGGRMTLTARDVVVLAALDDWIDQRDHGHSGGTAVIGEPLRSDLIAEIRRVPWGEEVVASSLYNGTVVTSAPRWQCVTAASPSLTDPTDG